MSPIQIVALVALIGYAIYRQTRRPGFGEVLLMIALMVAFQAELIWRRAQPLGWMRVVDGLIRGAVGYYDGDDGRRALRRRSATAPSKEPR